MVSEMKGSYSIGGALIAGFIGFFCGCFFSCGEMEVAWAVGFAFALFGALIGFLIGYSADKEEEEKQQQEYWRKEEERKRREEAEKKRKEEQKRQALEKQHYNFANQLHQMYRSLEKNIGPGYDPKDAYEKIFKIRNEGYLDSYEITEYENQLRAHIEYLHKELHKCLLRELGIGGLAQSAFVLDCLAILKPGVQEYTNAAEVLRNTLQVAMPTLCYMSSSGYGEFKLPLDSDDEMSRVAAKADILLNEVAEVEAKLRDAEKDMVGAVLQYVNPELIKNQCMLMWYYAKQKPFDVNRFEKARSAFLTHTALYCKDPGVKEEMKAYAFGGEKMKVIALGKVEEVLARIYSKNQIGGAGTVRQEKDYIDFWLEQRIQYENYDECYMLASGLAWMELYELELDVLRKLVAADVQLPTDMQERLSFLESGGTVNIKLYDVDSSKEFCFDNSSTEWKAKEFSVFFRKMAMKKTCVKYSMAISKWAKTLPLAGGQKVSKEQLYEEFMALVEDFDGEITCVKTDAVAINLANVDYPDAVLFRFTSERNRCVSVLFSCEKYGRNLNLTILTLFTPEDNIPFEELEKYCMAIKDNVYVESFRESILQVVDEAIKVKQSVYDDDVVPKKKKVFDGEG